jgi:hypothetical protein
MDDFLTLGFICTTTIASNAGNPLLPTLQPEDLDDVIQDHSPPFKPEGTRNQTGEHL